jgi:anaerobic magnesium-protoporphyrin IX monomethyl ester cyclase
MSEPSVLLVNPRITSRRKARFPLSIMSLAAALEPDAKCLLLDGNIDPDASATAHRLAQSTHLSAVGITVMGGPQLAPAIELSRAVRAARPDVPIVWGGYFPTLYPEVALNCDYVDYVVRGQGESTFRELIRALNGGDSAELSRIKGLSFWDHGKLAHNVGRPFAPSIVSPLKSFGLLHDPKIYAVQSFLGQRTVGYQASIGCRYRCTFCGVAAAFKGATALPSAQRLHDEIAFLRAEVGADSIQFYDHNFFDREEAMVPLLDVLAQHGLPWWCYARADALLNLADSSWKLLRESRLRMAYIGAEAPNDLLLRAIRKGTRTQQTLDVVELCRRNGVIPELSFMVAPPDDPDGETERTFEFVRRIKQINPETEVIIYVYTPLPASSVPNADRLKLAPLRDTEGNTIQFPRTPEEWTERRWLDYACHMDAPWLTDRLRHRIRDFVTVLRCRFPTIQDTNSPRWMKSVLRGLASWRYATRRYESPWELRTADRLIGLIDPRASSL